MPAGANPNALNKEGKPPLWYAADLGLPGNIARVLLEAGADKEGKVAEDVGILRENIGIGNGKDIQNDEHDQHDIPLGFFLGLQLKP